MQKLTLFFLFLLGSFTQVTAQSDWPFYSSIHEFKKKDSISFPEKGGILFIGSSSIRRWVDLNPRVVGGSSCEPLIPPPAQHAPHPVEAAGGEQAAADRNAAPAAFHAERPAVPQDHGRKPRGDRHQDHEGRH